MALSQRLEMRQSQALVMTPQLMQAIKLLQLSNLDLVAYVEGELERNPLLERTSDSEAAAEPDLRAAESNPDGEGDGTAGDYIGPELETSRSAIEERLGTDLDNVFPDEPSREGERPAAAEMPGTYSEWS